MSEIKKSATALAEEEILRFWAKEKTFEKSLANRKGGPYFSFYDGPPFANGLPHFGHSLVTGIKDALLRYKTMRGYYVPRRNGWDCHGLPVEYDVEKQFGVSGKKQILELGLEKFNAACRDSIFRYKADWEAFLNRFGRWSDYDNYYATVDTDYTESVWWILSEIYKKGLLYKSFKSLPYCPRCATPLSNFELNEGYRDNVPDPSVFVTFPLKDDPKTKLLAWTTTPWTLPANAALGIDAKADYAYVKLNEDGSTLILAKARLDVLDLRKSQYQLLKTVKGQDLIGLRYQPLYGINKQQFSKEQLDNAWQVLAEDSVSLKDGTGILHSAPRYGEADLNMGLEHKLPLIESVNNSGHLVWGPKEALGKFFKSADQHIIADLTKKGRVFAAETAQHTYPFCWRCETPLMYFATDSWFIEVTKVKDQMIKTAQDINWTPANIKKGRFGMWLEGARDWAISRNRYWGAPMPIWVNTEDENDFMVVGSIAQLEELAGHPVGDDLHRPFIDKVVIKKGAKTYKRVEEVLDCWFESGSMPVAQWHYPFENKAIFDQTFPADFITEAIDQTRLWFYVQHVISTILFNRPAYGQVIVSGFMMAADGQKLSKRLRNYPPVQEVFNDEGADALRLYLLSRPQGTQTADYMRFDRSAMTDIKRNVLDTLNNSFKFFKTYAGVDGWQARKIELPRSDNLLDKWILARLAQTTSLATASVDNYKIAHAILPVFDLINDLSNWYIRRSRRRFWKSENDLDKDLAYATLHYSLVRISQLLAPWAPFISDHLWRELTKGLKAEKSVHLSDWPSDNKPDNASFKILLNMSYVRGTVNLGLAKRAEVGIKVRQPLSKVTVLNAIIEDEDQAAYEQIIKDELNVKTIEIRRGADQAPEDNLKRWSDQGYKEQDGGEVEIILNTAITPELKSEGIMRELVRNIQNARKKAGLQVDDRIRLSLESGSEEIQAAIKRFKAIIFAETLVTGELNGEGDYSETVKVEGQEVKLGLSKV